MANHISAKKRIRQSESRRVHNRYYAVTMRKAIGKFRSLKDKSEAEKMFPTLVSLIDKNVKRNIIHKNKAGHLKSQMKHQLNAMG